MSKDKINKIYSIVLIILTFLITYSLFEISDIGLEKKRLEEWEQEYLNKHARISENELSTKEAFEQLDFTQDTIYFDKNYFYYDISSQNMSHSVDINWWRILYQNKEVYDSLKSFKDLNIGSINFDDSEIQYINGQISQLSIIWEYNSFRVVKKIDVKYIDYQKLIESDSLSVYLAGQYISTGRYKDYYITFFLYDNDYYEIGIKRLLEDEEGKIYRADGSIQFTDKYVEPIHYEIEGVEVLKVWKDHLGFRVEVINDLKIYSDDIIFLRYLIYPNILSQYGSNEFSAPNIIDFIKYSKSSSSYEIGLIDKEDKKIFQLNEGQSEFYLHNGLGTKIQLSQPKIDVLCLTIYDKIYDSKMRYYFYIDQSNVEIVE